MFITEVGNSFDREVHLGVFHRPLAGAPDNGRSAAPSFGTDGGVQYMFYEAGQRSRSTIAVARAFQGHAFPDGAIREREVLGCESGIPHRVVGVRVSILV
ncbi:hypothetical protein [Streptosporangium sp. NPDC049644]|uniref:hypothetical protein n=1 Tax=Streptosporangium sp. NPDC049644 TaxID=3155507 RepID=UPI003412BB35